MLGVAGFAVILIPALTALAEVAASRGAADDAAMVVVRAWTSADTSQRQALAQQVASRLEQESGRRLRVDVSCTRACTDPASAVVVSVSVATGLRFPAQVRSLRRGQGDVYAP